MPPLWPWLMARRNERQLQAVVPLRREKATSC